MKPHSNLILKDFVIIICNECLRIISCKLTYIFLFWTEFDIRFNPDVFVAEVKHAPSEVPQLFFLFIYFYHQGNFYLFHELDDWVKHVEVSVYLAGKESRKRQSSCERCVKIFIWYCHSQNGKQRVIFHFFNLLGSRKPGWNIYVTYTYDACFLDVVDRC